MVVAAETYIDDRVWGDNSVQLTEFFTGFDPIE
jgi:hypothetical protein